MAPRRCGGGQTGEMCEMSEMGEMKRLNGLPLDMHISPDRVETYGACFGLAISMRLALLPGQQRGTLSLSPQRARLQGGEGG